MHLRTNTQSPSESSGEKLEVNPPVWQNNRPLGKTGKGAAGPKGGGWNWKDWAGIKTGRLLVIERAPRRQHAKKESPRWNCQCECGNNVVLTSSDLSSGRSQCRHCSFKESGLARRKHGLSFSRAYHSWNGMKGRCTNPKKAHWSRYGGRGITFCPQWDSFEQFLLDMGEPPEGYTLNRIDNDGNYTPENCEWASQTTQARNKCNNRLIEHNGVTKNLSAWCEELGLSYRNIKARLRRMSFEEAITKPFRKPRKPKQ